MALGPPTLDQLTSDDRHGGVLESSRDAPPTHCTFTIQSLSLLSKASIDLYETSPFEAGGYNWKLRIYVNGNKNRNIKEHISLYLVMADTDSLPRGWDVNVVFRLFLFDQIRDKYLIIEDANVTGKRFHRTKTEWGFDKFIAHKSFNESSNGYLVDDVCIFGAEVFVCNESCRSKDERLSMIKGAVLTKHSWKIDSFSKIDKEYVESEKFIAGDHTCIVSEAKRVWHDQFLMASANLIRLPNTVVTSAGFQNLAYAKQSSTCHNEWHRLTSALEHLQSDNAINGKIQLYPKGFGEGKGTHLGLGLALADSEILPTGREVYAEFNLRLVQQSDGRHIQSKVSRWFGASCDRRRWPKFSQLSYLSQQGFLLKDSCFVEAEVTVLGIAN